MKKEEFRRKSCITMGLNVPLQSSDCTRILTTLTLPNFTNFIKILTTATFLKGVVNSTKNLICFNF